MGYNRLIVHARIIASEEIREDQPRFDFCRYISIWPTITNPYWVTRDLLIGNKINQDAFDVFKASLQNIPANFRGWFHPERQGEEGKQQGQQERRYVVYFYGIWWSFILKRGWQV